jgi:hypothetical protein
MLARIINYANKVLNLRTELGRVTESVNKRNNRKTSTGVLVGCLMTMALCRLGSFNAVETNKGRKIWRQLMGRKNNLCSADTLGRRATTVKVESVRSLLLNTNRKMRRNKALEPLRKGGYATVAVDGHEINCSYLRDFGDSICLQREITQKDGSKRTQYYQRLVCAVLVCNDHTQLLDMEMQLPGESEVAAALRLLERISVDYYHLFDVVMADGLYAQAPFFKAVRKMNKHVIAVLKDERRDLTEDVRLLLPVLQSQSFNRGKNDKIKVAAWDIEELTTWPQTGQTVRVVRTEETRTVIRQARSKKNSPIALSKRLPSSGCGLPHYLPRPFPPRISSILHTTAGISRTNASMSCPIIGMSIIFTNTISTRYKSSG